MFVKTFILLTSVLFLCSLSTGYRILVFFPLPLQTHVVPFQSLVHELATRGHEMTEVSMFAPAHNHSNYRHLPIPLSHDVRSINVLKFGHLTGHDLVRKFSDYCLARTEETLQLPEIQRFIQEDTSTFDLIFVPGAFCGESFVALGHKYSAPIINFQTMGYRSSTAYILGNLLPPTSMVDFRLPFTSKMTFFQTLYNVYMFYMDLYDMHFYYHPRVDAMMKKYFTYPGDDTRPDLHTLQKNIAMTFVEHDPTLGIPHPLAPNIQFTGGLQLRDAQPLPPKLDRFISEAPHGVIFVSLGSIIQVSSLPKSTVDAFLQAFERLKYRIVWKTDIQVPVSENVLLGRWFPQTDILGHPNCKLFITHGGIHSTMETGFLGVPVVMLPGFSDQFQNVKVMEERGMGVILELKTMTAGALVNAVEEVINTPKYKETVRKISRAMRSAPLSGLEKAARWTEFVAENKGAPYLRPEGRNLSLVRVLGIDLVLVAALVAALGTVVIVILLKWTVRLAGSVRDKKQKVQ